MRNRTFLALAVLAAVPSLACSSEIKIYGKVDVGLSFTHIDSGVQGADSASSLSMASG